MALTRQGAPVPLGTAKGIGVKAGIGVLEVVATALSPTSIYAAVVDQTTTPCGPDCHVEVLPAVPVYATAAPGKLACASGFKSSKTYS